MGETPGEEGGGMIAKARPPVYVVIGAFDAKKLPKKCVVERVPDELLDALATFMRWAKDDGKGRRT